MALPDTQVRIFAEELSTLRKDVTTLQQAMRSAQLGQSTIDDGALGITSNGVMRGQIGIASDGSFAVIASNAPPPPPPSAPTCTPIATGVMVRWDGNFNGAARPRDFSFVEIWHNTTNNFATATLDGNMTDPGEWPVAPLTSGGTHYFWLTAKNTSSKRSDPSGVATAVPEQVVAQALLDGIVTELKLANEAVSANKIKLGAVGQAQLGNQAVSLTNLANGSVDATKLVNGAVTQPAIATDAVTANAIAANSVIAGKVATDSISANELLANSVGASEIVTNAVTSDKIVSNAVTADKINALAVTADKVAANAINAGHIQAGSITAAKLATTLLLSTTIIAGTSTTGARVQLTSNGIEAFRSNGMRTLFFDSNTGNMTIAGQYRSADGGSRVEINPGGGAPDEVRFYQGSNYAYVNAETAPGSTAAIVGRSQRVSGNLGSFGCYPTEAFLATDNNGTQRGAISVLTDAVNIWAPNTITQFHRTSSGTIINNSRLHHIRAGGGEATLQAPNLNSLLVWGPSYLFAGDNNFLGIDVIAKNLAASSSETLKTDITENFGMPAKQLFKQVKGKKFKLNSDLRGRPAKPEVKTEIRRKDKDGKDMVDAKGKAVMDIVDAEWEHPQKPVRDNYFLVAEDLQRAAPDLVERDPTVPGGLLVRHGDLIGWLWKLGNELVIEIDELQEQLASLKLKVK